jgi:pimeloyl-ACP methyl ester carboxylesterase
MNTIASQRPRKTRRTIMNIIVGVIGLIVVCAVGGAIYQIVASNNDRRSFPPPGQLIDVGDHRLHLLAMGEDHGGPTVVLESGTMAFSSYWAWVQPEIAKFARVVAYDRAGLGWSEPGPKPRDAQHIAMELHTALRNAGIEGPYVLVGHSEGGLYAPVFATLYPDEVAGLVLIDPEHPDVFNLPNGPGIKQGSMFIGTWGPLIARLGIGRLIVPNMILKEADGSPIQLPPRQLAETIAFFESTSAADANSAEVEAWDGLTFPQVRSVTSLGSKPVVILTAGRGWGWAAVHEQWAKALTQNSAQRVIDTTHGGMLTNQADAHFVVDAVREVIESARAGAALRP